MTSYHGMSQESRPPDAGEDATAGQGAAGQVGMPVPSGHSQKLAIEIQGNRLQLRQRRREIKSR